MFHVVGKATDVLPKNISKLTLACGNMRPKCIKSAFSLYIGIILKNRTRPHPYHGCDSRPDHRRLAASPVRLCGAQRAATGPLLAMLGAAPAHPPSCSLRSPNLSQSTVPIAKGLPCGSPFVIGAFNRNRTDDLILTMDALYRLSYKGVYGAGEGNRTLAVSLGS